MRGLEPGGMERPRWTVLFGPITDLPFGDADLWEDHGLPVAGGEAYPVAIRFGAAEVRRADARSLAYLEGLLDAVPSTASSPLERAQDIAYRAFEARGRRRVQLARKALELSRDCADAWVILGEHATDLERARELYAEGVSAGERALGPRVFEEEAGHFWGLVETRPYMRARCSLAQVLERLGGREEAMGQRERQSGRPRAAPAGLAHRGTG